MYQAGTLSGNPIAMAAGIANLKKIIKKDFFTKLNRKSDKLIVEINDLIERHGLGASVNSIGSMFTIFFNDQKVVDYKTAIKSDTKMFSKFFGILLSNGIIFPPSQFESVFVSAVHTKNDFEKTLSVINKAFKNL